MTIVKTTPCNILENYYWVSVTVYWFFLIVGPLLFIILPTYYYYSGITGIESFFLYIFIPILILLAVFLIKPIMKDSKCRLIGTFRFHPIYQISSYVKSILQENNIEFSTSKNYRRNKGQQEYYDIYYRAKNNGLEIGLAKGSSNKNATFVSIRYLSTTNKTMIEQIKNSLEKKASESGIIQ